MTVRPRLLLTGILFFLAAVMQGQNKPAVVTGKIVDENERPLSKVSISILGKNGGTSSNDSGTFRILVPSNRAFALLFSHMGYTSLQRNFLLNEGETEKATVKMERGSASLATVVVTDQRQRRESGLVLLNPKNAINIPSPLGGIESLIKVIVGSNNELTSQYTVRGGNYDENLIYVNDFEVYRPYLVRSGQQEGLSFINPELTRNVNFYNGGFQARYGDKMSSVLDIQYRKPRDFGGSVHTSLLEQGFHLEGSSRNRKFTFLTGMRNRSNRNLLSSQETKGNYVPSSSDFQALLTYQYNEKNSFELLGNLSRTRFNLAPQFSQLTSTIFSQYFSANLGLDIYFDGAEEDAYRTGMAGLSWLQQPRSNLRLKWMASYFADREKESIDIAGAYLFGEREFDKSKSDFGSINNPLGAGLYQTFARNRLQIDIWSLAHKGTLDMKKHYLQWGWNLDRQQVGDKLNEWEYQDSAGYNLPYNPSVLQLNKVLKSTAALEATRISGYVQDNILFSDSADFTVQAGLRFNYNTLNREVFLTPRVGWSWKPSRWERDVIFRGAAGWYYQPPFYRELRGYNGYVNTKLLSQKSVQVTGGLDYNFKLGERPLRITSEVYYKKMWDVVPYDIDNVRIRYFGENKAKAYAAGIEGRLYGELVKDAESWISIGFMRTRENLRGDYFYNYRFDSTNTVIDSTRTEGGWFRRPSDRFFTFGMFLQDYLSTNKNFKVFLNLLYGSNLPYNIPGSVKYRNGLVINPYMRIDLGLSVLLLDSDKTNRRSHMPFRNFENIWASL
ncbi:MAG: hypothetical protein RL732_588, partial [Bacteroidota bacterium]